MTRPRRGRGICFSVYKQQIPRGLWPLVMTELGGFFCGGFFPPDEEEDGEHQDASDQDAEHQHGGRAIARAPHRAEVLFR